MRSEDNGKAYFAHIPTEEIKASKINPRKHFDPLDIEELAKSFKEYGIIQPIIVYPHNSKFIIICGERRWRAAKRANLEKMPAVVHPTPPSDEEAISLALIENMHRKDIDVLNEAAAIRGLVDGYGWTQLDLADKLGVSITYVRNRYLVMKFADVLSAFENKEISFSEAVELSTIEDAKSRVWFLQRLINKEFGDFRQFSLSVARYRNLKKAIDEKHFINQPLDRKRIEFKASGLPYCSPNCAQHLRLSWNEKKHFGIELEKPGWSEYCVALNNECYKEKKDIRSEYIEKLKRIEDKRPIVDEGWESMLWFEHQNKSCRTCKFMVDASDFEMLGEKIKDGVHAYCTFPKPHCFEKQSKAYAVHEEKRKRLIIEKEEERKQRLIEEVSKSTSGESMIEKKNFSKRECTYLILQFLCYAGGQGRLQEFAQKHSLHKNMPSKYSSQINFIRNKLMDCFPEGQLHEVLFSEAALSAGYSEQEIQPLFFDRREQKEIPISI